jgi:hypothetical protein
MDTGGASYTATERCSSVFDPDEAARSGFGSPVHGFSIDSGHLAPVAAETEAPDGASIRRPAILDTQLARL